MNQKLGAPHVSVGCPWVHGRRVSGARALEGVGVHGAAIVRRCRRQIRHARDGLRVFGIVGATNVANETKEFEPAQSIRLLGRFGAMSGAKGAKEFMTQG